MVLAFNTGQQRDHEMSLTEPSILSIPSNALTKLVYALTVESPLDPPRDWRGLAAYVGFPHRVISLIEQHRESSKAWHVFRLWERTGTSSLRKLLIALMELNLRECLDILRGELGGMLPNVTYGAHTRVDRSRSGGRVGCSYWYSRCMLR